MGKIQNQIPVKLIMGVTYRPEFDPYSIYPPLEKSFSEIEISSAPYDFSSFTKYYTREMGDHLKKHFIVFRDLIQPEHLVQAKLTTNLIEQKHIIEDKRVINLDPGYITQAKLILATTKNYSHRIYLGQGIFGDVHMHYQEGQYRPNSWTYPDYKAEINVDFFGRVRKHYLEQLGTLKQ